MSESHNLKKELKNPDWFHRVIDDLAHKIANHRSGMIIGIVAIGVLIIAALFYAQHLSSVDEKALVQLEAIEEEYYKAVDVKAADPKSAETLDGIATKLKSLVEKESGTYAAATASFYLGEIAYQQGKYAEAISAYEIYARRLPNNGPLTSMVLSNIGYAYEAQNKSAEAAQAFLKAAQSTGAPMRDQLFVNAARNFEKAGKALEARTYYQKVMEDFPESTLQNLVKSKLAQLASAK